MSAIAVAAPSVSVREHKKPLYRHLYVQVVGAILLGIACGQLYPDLGVALKPLGDVFIKAVKMIIAPIIFCTVVHGIASVGDLRKVGRIGVKSLIYFEILTTLALLIGLVAMYLARPGVGMHVDPTTLDPQSVAAVASGAAKSMGVVDYLAHIVPNTLIGAFAEGEILQVLFVSLLFAVALVQAGPRVKPLVDVIDITAKGLFGVVGIVMKAAPLGAFGAMAFTVGKYGIVTLLPMLKMVAIFYLTCIVFVLVVLGAVARMAGFSILKVLRYIREELFVVLGTSSSETALPRLMDKLRRAGCGESTVGLVVPGGYSFNLDGTCINLATMALFLAQATDTSLGWEGQLALIGVLLLTSKGAASVTGGSFVVLAATLPSLHTIAVASLALILGVYRFISEGGALVNTIGNGVAAIVVARWEGDLDTGRLHAALAAD
ncbi:MAG: C4-dicarboxylate transporter DctA [Methylorubrum populi]